MVRWNQRLELRDWTFVFIKLMTMIFSIKLKGQATNFNLRLSWCATQSRSSQVQSVKLNRNLLLEMGFKSLPTEKALLCCIMGNVGCRVLEPKG